jgi:hypothetical protein
MVQHKFDQVILTDVDLKFIRDSSGLAELMLRVRVVSEKEGRPKVLDWKVFLALLLFAWGDDFIGEHLPPPAEVHQFIISQAVLLVDAHPLHRGEKEHIPNASELASLRNVLQGTWANAAANFRRLFSSRIRGGKTASVCVSLAAELVKRNPPTSVALQETLAAKRSLEEFRARDAEFRAEEEEDLVRARSVEEWFLQRQGRLTAVKRGRWSRGSLGSTSAVACRAARRRLRVGCGARNPQRPPRHPLPALRPQQLMPRIPRGRGRRH